MCYRLYMFFFSINNIFNGIYRFLDVIIIDIYAQELFYPISNIFQLDKVLIIQELIFSNYTQAGYVFGRGV